MVRNGLTEEVILEQKPEGGEGATGRPGGGAFQAKGRAGAKALRWERARGLRSSEEASVAGAG